MHPRAQPEPGEAETSRAVAPVLLVGSDASEGAARALGAAGRLAARVGGRIIVAHVRPNLPSVPSASFVDQLRDDLEMEVMLQAAAALDPLRVLWQLVCVSGDPAHALSWLADEHHVELLVVGSRGCGAGQTVRRLVAGSVSGYLVHHEHRPVLVIPASGDLARR